MIRDFAMSCYFLLQTVLLLFSPVELAFFEKISLILCAEVQVKVDSSSPSASPTADAAMGAAAHGPQQVLVFV